MAYLDDNNENLYTAGDPLEALDRELAELKSTLGEMEGQAAPADDPTPDIEEKIPDEKAQPEPTPKEIPAEEPAKSETEEDMKKTKNKEKNRTPLIALLIILTVLLIGSIGFGVYRMVAPGNVDSTAEPTASGKVVTVTDSEMGELEIQTAKGAKLNTLTAENLTTEKDGTYAYYEDGVKISHLGADLSEFQSGVDFEALKKAGVEFVMLRVGGRYYGEKGTMYEDTVFEDFYEKAQAAGLKIGAYFLSQATTVDEAKEEANFILKKLNGRKLSYPIAFDWENIGDDEARTDNVTGETLTLMAEAFCDTISESGYKPIVYSNTDQMFTRYDFETMKDYDFWLADYRDFPNMYYKFDMWQYTKEGTIDGIEGTVDLNLSFTDFSE